MKKTLRLLTMASLAVAGALMAGCSGSDDILTLSVLTFPRSPIFGNPDKQGVFQILLG